MTKIRIFTLVFLFLLLAGFCVKAEEGKPLEWPDNLVRGQLDNGFSYIIKEHKKPEERVLAWLVVQAGSIFEREDQRGIAHYLEHMGFNGTRTFPKAGELVKYFQSIGVDIGPDINAFTSFDRTVYIVEIGTESDEDISKGLTALCDYGAFMLLTPEEVDRERSIILEELRLGSTLGKRLYEQNINIVLKDSLYPERLPIGLEENIEAFQSEDFKEFYSDWYRPDMMTLVVVGDYDALEMEKKVKKIFADMPSPEGERPELTVPFVPHEEIYTGVITDEELEESSIEISFLRDPHVLTTEEHYRRDLADRIVFEMIRSRLDQETYKENTPIIYAYCYESGWLKSMTRVLFGASVVPGKTKEAMEIVSSYVEGMRNYGFNDIEREEAESTILERLRKFKEEADTTDAISYVSQITSRVMHDSIFLSPEQNYELALEIIPKITNEELEERIAFLLEPVNMSAIIETAPQEADEITAEDVSSIIAEVMEQGGTEYVLEELDYSYDYSSLEPGEIISRKDYEDTGITELELSNGLTVILKPTDFDKDSVKVKYVSAGGKLLDSPFTPGMFDVARKAWGRGGTVDLTQFQVERLLSGKTISFRTGGNVLYGIHGSCSKNELEELCQWMWQYLERPGYRKEGIDFGIKLTQEHIRRFNQVQEGLMSHAENDIILPNNPLSFNFTEEEVALYNNPEELKKFQDMSCVPSNSELLIVGAFELEEGVNFACKYFGSLPADGNPDIPCTYFKTDFPSGNTKRIIYKGIEDRCKGYIIFPGCMRWDDDNILLDVLAQIIDMRCWEVIREEKGLAYSAGVKNISPITIDGTGKFKVVFGTDPEKVDKLIDGVMIEIEDIKTNGPTEEELSSALKIMISAYEEKMQENYYWLGVMEGSSLFGFSPELEVENYHRLPAVTSEEIKDTAVKYLDDNNKIILFALPENDEAGDDSQSNE